MLRSALVFNSANTLSKAVIDENFQSWFHKLDSTRYREESNDVAWMRLNHLLTFACEGYKHLNDMNDKLQEEVNQTKRVSLEAQQKLEDDSKEHQREIQELKQKNSELQRWYDLYQEQRVKLVNAMQQAYGCAQMLQQLGDVTSANCLQAQIDAKVAERAAALEEEYAAQLREKDHEKDEALQMLTAATEIMEKTAAQLREKDEALLALNNDVSEAQKTLKGTFILAKFYRLVSRYNLLKAASERNKQVIDITKELKQHMAKIELDSEGRYICQLCFEPG